MKKYSLFAASALFLTLSLSSCGEKCIVCTFGDTSIADSEYCSKDKDLRNAFESSQEAIATLAGTTVDCD